ncbi:MULTISPECIES: hypothetical protein [unclassified Rhizobium]|uniref:hypothetical protein n=1 Tax=unclassified Rhizobium TaxID=2613769 RepID=UPI0007EB90E9|nr:MULTISPECIES: hypothetical protein [unclassified Rhizobium]ANL11987.1 hypothetical protein AMJ98_PA00041 [Rhizobium sp. N1341]ANM42832.1 hypothetical protein AMK03_PA00041 [Rhizobium sp. N741]
MKKTITATIAALFMTTSLIGPAAAGNDLLRLGIGVGAALIGEAMKGGGNHRSGGREPGKGDTLLGPVGGKQQPTRQASGKSKPTKADDKAQWASYVPTTPAIPAAKPTDEEMVAWAAAAPEREAQEEQAEAEMAQAPVVATDATTTAAVTATPTADVAAAPTAPAEEATEEARYGDEYWGKITKSQMEKALKFGSLGMSTPDAYRAIGLKGPIDEQAAEPTGFDLIDENGKLWGNVPKEKADNVWKAVDMGMKPSDAIRAIAKLEDPDVVKAKAAAEAEADKVAADKTLAKCIKNELDYRHYMFLPMGGPVKYTECRPYEAQIAEAVAKDEAEETAADQAKVAACVEDYVKTGTYDCPFHEKEFRAAVAYLDADPSRRKALEQSMAAKETAKRDAEAQAQINAIFANQPAPSAENKPAFSAPSAENQTAAAPSIDEGKTAAIDEAKPEAAKPVEQQPPAKKKMKLDL